MRKFFLTAIAVLVIIGLATGIYMWNKPHINMQRASADLAVSASDLMAAFNEDESAANAKYRDKVVAVKGKVLETNTNGGVTIVSMLTNDDFGAISCELDQRSKQKRTEFSAGEEIVLKGICVGKTIDVVMVRCVLVE
ncbi:MAG: hypothetical protein SFU99_06585 [Saprospiraceae bacterium]|nr:hypothetical protein [Saprospiraceae bacterium]